MQKGLISVIVPVYKVENYLDKCIESIVNQTYKNLEIIIVDDGSTDNCPKTCDSWAKKDKRIKVIHKANGGISSARNVGLDVVTGEYVGFVDGDDFIESDMYEKLLNKLQLDNADISMGNIRKVYPAGGVDVIESNITRLNSAEIFKYFVLNNYSTSNNEIQTDNIMGSVCRSLFKRQIIGNVKFLDIFSEDLLFYIDVIKPDTKIVGISDIVYNYVQRETSLTYDIKKEKIDKKISFMKTAFERLETKVPTQYLSSYKFYQFKALYVEILNSSNCNELLEYIKHNEFINLLNTKENYKNHQSLTKIFKTKILSFLIHNKFFAIYKLLKR